MNEIFFFDTFIWFYLVWVPYLIGSIPFGFLITKFFLRYDIRTQGSKNIGTANVIRTGNKTAGFFTLLLDAGKASLIIWLVTIIYGSKELQQIALVFTIIGHCFSVFLLFRGGKGVATVFGGTLLLSPTIFIINVILWLLIFIIKRYAGLSAILCSMLIPIITYWVDREVFWGILVSHLIILLCHRTNIINLYHRKEKKL